jgi:hypothetical protein
MCSHGSVMTEQPVCFVGYSASDFAGSAQIGRARSQGMTLTRIFHKKAQTSCKALIEWDV